MKATAWYLLSAALGAGAALLATGFVNQSGHSVSTACVNGAPLPQTATQLVTAPRDNPITVNWTPEPPAPNETPLQRWQRAKRNWDSAVAIHDQLASKISEATEDLAISEYTAAEEALKTATCSSLCDAKEQGVRPSTSAGPEGPSFSGGNGTPVQGQSLCLSPDAPLRYVPCDGPTPGDSYSATIPNAKDVCPKCAEGAVCVLSDKGEPCNDSKATTCVNPHCVAKLP